MLAAQEKEGGEEEEEEGEGVEGGVGATLCGAANSCKFREWWDVVRKRLGKGRSPYSCFYPCAVERAVACCARRSCCRV